MLNALRNEIYEYKEDIVTLIYVYFLIQHVDFFFSLINMFIERALRITEIVNNKIRNPAPICY